MKPVPRVRTLALLLLALPTLAAPVRGQDPCPSASGADAEAGWTAYVANDMTEARQRFQTALARCDNDHYSRTGLAYVDLREGDTAEAERLLIVVITAEPNNIDALVGLGLVAWRGADLEAVQEYFGDVIEVDPENATALDYLDRIEGRNAAAKEVLEQAVSLSPTNGDAREQLRAVNVALTPLARPTTVYESDSDGNRMLTTSLTIGFHPTPRLDVRVDGYRRSLEQGPLDRRAFGGTVTGAYQFNPGWTLSGGVGANRTNGLGDPTFAILRGGLRSPDRHKLGFAVSVASGGLDETAVLADRGVRYKSLSASARLMPGSGWRIDGSVGRFLFDSSQDNTRNSARLAVSKRLGTMFSLGTSFRAFGYDKDVDDGYFDPDFYRIGELTSYWRYRPLPWAFLVEAAPGIQQVTTDGDPTFSLRGSARLAYLVAPGRELSLSVSYSSAGLLSLSETAGDSGYEYRAVILGFNWVL